MRPFRFGSRGSAIVVAAVCSLLSGPVGTLLGACGPLTDVAPDSFCPFVLEILYLGITTGTTPTTYDPSGNVSRLQMAAFLSRSVDGLLRRGSRRAALDQFWTPQGPASLGLTSFGSDVAGVRSDGADLWVANIGGDSVFRVRGSDGKRLETWTGAMRAGGILIAMGRVIVTGNNNPGTLYRIDPSQAPGAVTTVATNLGGGTLSIAFDGGRIWTSNSIGSVSIVTPGATLPWTVTTVGAGFSAPRGILYDGANVWLADATPGVIDKLDAAGAILQTVTVGAFPLHPTFDGANIWVPNGSGNSVTVVRASSGAVLATLTGNGLSNPFSAAFDGQRVLVTDFIADTVSLFKAADLSPLGSLPTAPGSHPYFACSDGVGFWFTITSPDQLARF